MRRCGLLIFAMLLAGLAAMAPANAAPRPIVRIEGELPPDLRRQLEATLPRGDALPPTPFDARRAAAGILDTVLELLTAQGYYAAQADIDAEPAGAAAQGVVRVKPGPLFLFAAGPPDAPEIDLSGPLDAATADRLRAAARLTPEAPATGLAVVTAEAAGLAALRAAGYADAAVLPRLAEADHATGRLLVRFAYDPGAPVLLGPVLLGPVLTGPVLAGPAPTGPAPTGPATSEPAPSGLHTRTNPDTVARMAGWRIGDRYTPEALETLRRRLIDTGAFDAAAVDLAPPGTGADAATGGAPAGGPSTVRPVIVSLTDRRAHTISLGASASTTEGVGVEGEWRRRNLLRRADTLVLSARLASLERALGAEISAPQGTRAGRLVTLAAELTNRTTDAFDQTGVTARAGLQEDRPGERLLALGATLDASRIHDTAGARTVTVAGLVAEGRLDRSDSLLDPGRGWRAQARLEPTLAGGDLQAAFIRAEASGSAYLPVGSQGRLTLAGRLRAASLIGASPAAVPADRRFYAGGGGSVRGYDYQSLSPTDPATGRITGGASLAEGGAELRGRITRTWGFAAFVDAGGASPDVTPRARDLRVGVGIGLRHHAGFGPIRADIAAPLDRRAGQGRVQFYLSLGQAF